MDEKQRLRGKLRAGRRDHVDALPDSTRRLLFLRPPAPLAALIPQDATVGLYHAIRAEAPTAAYARWFLENGRTIALPRFAAKDAPMSFAAWTDPFANSDLHIGPHGIPEPCEAAETYLPDVVFVPLLGFTPRCDRLGQGGGHYDRWLAAHPGVIAIGLAWDCQLCDELPVEPHDVPLRAVVTPTRFYEGS